MNQSDKINIAIFIGIWDFILCLFLFQVLNIWGIFYPLLCVFKELKSYYSNQLLKVISLLRISIVLLSMITLFILLPRLLIRIVEVYPYFHINDYYCTVDWICDDELKFQYLWNIVYASFAIVIDFIGIRPKISKYYDL